MDKNYRWGIIGAGRIADKFCTAINFVQGSQVYAIASRDEEKAKSYATKFGASTRYNNYDDLIQDENIDIIYVALPHVFHFDTTMKCLANKKAVLCEKPMSLSYAHTKKMIEAATENNVFLMEGMWTACMPFIDKIKSIIEKDIIGKPQYLSANFGFAAPDSSESRLYNKKLGGGSIVDVGIYPLFLSTLLFGTPTTIKSVSKVGITGVDEYTNVVLQYPGGETAHLLSSICFNTDIEAEIIGIKGSIKIKNPWFKATDFSVKLKDGSVQNFSIPHLCNGFEHEIKEVMDCLDRGSLQSEKMPHQWSMVIAEVMDEILQQAGVVYEQSVEN